MAYQFEPGQKYSFSTYAPQLLGNEFNAVTVKSVLGYEDAISESDVQALHQSVIGYITDPGVNVPRDYKKLTYIKVDTGLGNRRIIAIEWIREDTIIKISTVNVNITCFNIDNAKIPMIRQALLQNGITNFEIDSVAG